MKKITLVGAGRVGESAAQILAKEEMCRDIMLIDVREGVPEGTALDLQECGPLFNFDTKISGATALSAMAGSDIIIVSAGIPRKPGMSRSDVLDANVPVIRSIVEEAKRSAPNAMLLMVTNPVDVLTYLAWKHSGWDRNRVFGLSGVLDAARMAGFVAMETGLSVKGLTTLVIGGHGDTMVPLPRFSTVNGVPIDQFLTPEKIARIAERTRGGGAEILALKKNSSAYDAPGAAVAAMVDAVNRNRKRLMPCVAVLDGEYGERGISMGVPVVLGERGVERIVELPLNAAERAELARSAAAIRADIEKLRV